ncbi:ATP-dependent DNA helicase UvrD2 [Pauljensenia sp. UMB3104]|uniref:ATP-dependent DNA helicase UvrD2 n=1 Tax=Pauljensenia sp. UMB3104 TaxID=3046331 RepID=UPI00254D698E|nr:ATP-dependent DNA helicase UvrD2 [Pauljensenia sp. UMB3104]MDK7158855.1 ATP-dependent DNA helicase UvrD2 [Pauljensenia sp. UMB3104]
MNPEELLNALDPDQRAVATQVAGPLAVLAGAGTGKTRAITYRIAYGAAVGAFDPSNVLAVTFTQRAAFEMRHRLAQLGVPKAQARTFHSAALRQLRHFWPTVVGGPLPDVIPHKASLVAASAARLGITIDRTNVRDIAAEVEWAKVSMVDAAHYASRVARLRRDVPAGLDAGDMARLLDVYEDAKNERGVIDFEDILIYLCGMLQERADVASIVRKQYRSFVVDEFQDVNLLQARLLDLWLGGRHDVCVVGDVAQTIYSFTGASPDYLTGFGRKHPGARIVELTRDYRSTPQIVSLANDVLAHSSQREGTVRLSSQREGGAQVTYRTYDDDRAEAEGVAASIADLIDAGMAPHSIAVLMRTNGQSQAFEEALGARGIPVAVAGGKPFFARDDVRTAISRLRAAAAAATDTGSVGEIVRDVLSGVGWAPEAPSGQAGSERWSNMNAIVGWADDSQAQTLPAFVAELDERVAYQVEPDKAGVELATIHAAKGLEWDAVFLVGVAEGLLPISYAKTAAAREEERRLLYVAITRARDLLTVSWARSRGADGRGKRKRSHLLDGIWPEEARVGAPKKRARASTRALNQAFEEEASPQAIELFGRLKAWRLEVSRQAGVPPFAVFTDQTLRDIAQAMPKNTTQLRIIRGIGDVKVQRFAAPVLALVRGEEVIVDEGA